MSIHHMTNTRLFNVWQNIKRRCYTKTNPSYKYYGACGIKVCKEWRENFISFYTWAMANGYDENAPKGVCTLDRIDIDGDYEPNNCRWATKQQQAHNRRTTRLITHNGETHSVSEWTKILGVNRTLLLNRLWRGWSEEEIFELPYKNQYDRRNK